MTATIEPVDTRATASTARFFRSQMHVMPGITMSVCSMLVRDRERKILVSPVGTDDEANDIREGLTALVAPSRYHYNWLAAVRARARPASVWGPPGLTDKEPDLAPLEVFGATPWPFADLLDAVMIEGAPERNEVVFFHRASRTLYTSDLFFNLRRAKGWLAPIAFRVIGTYKRFAVARRWRGWVKDRTSFDRSIERMLAWPFERLVMGHGDPIERDARSLVVKALRERDLLR